MFQIKEQYYLKPKNTPIEYNNLSDSATDVLNEIKYSNSINQIRVLKTKLLFINGLVSEIANRQTLMQTEFMGQYGNIIKTKITKSNQNFYSAFVEYATEAEAALALLTLDNFIYNGKIIRVFYGSTKYCYAFLQGAVCTIKYCVYSHEFEKNYTYFKQNTNSINHEKIATKILENNIHLFNTRKWDQAIFPNPVKLLNGLGKQEDKGIDESDWRGILPVEEWQELEKEIKGYVSKDQKKENTWRKRTRIQQFLEYAQWKLMGLIFNTSRLQPQI